MVASVRGQRPNEPRAGVQSVERAIGVLKLFQDGAAEQSITDIARQTGLNLSTAHRMVKALCGAQFMEQDPDTERYRLGSALMALGQRALQHSGFAAALPVLDRLAEQTGESASLGVGRDQEVIVVLASASQQRLRFDHVPGASIGLHASAMGKALLAFRPGSPETIVADLPELERYTDATITSRSELAAELARIREQGYAVNHEGRYAGVLGVAAAVVDRSGRARAAVGLQGPTARMSATPIESVGRVVRAAADEISRILGSDASPG